MWYEITGYKQIQLRTSWEKDERIITHRRPVSERMLPAHWEILFQELAEIPASFQDLCTA